MKRTTNLNGTWALGSSPDVDSCPADGWIDAAVPGDVHVALSVAGQLPADLFYRKNLLEAKWVEGRHWWYRRTFEHKGGVSANAELVFAGLDMFARVYLNGHCLGETANMHRTYRFDVSECLVSGENELRVQFLPTRPEVDALHERFPDYHAIFTPGRSLVRKAQCQFGWDWAPDALSLGIWKDVALEEFDGETIRDVFVETHVDGNLCFRVELASCVVGKTLEVAVVDGSTTRTERVETNGHNNFICLRLPSPRLWWPIGLGEQNMYAYTVRLVDGERVCDSWDGRFGIRKVEVEEQVVESDRMGFRLVVNGVPVFCKGANWVPVDCFPGVARDETYEYLIKRAVEANFNMLRVWGGGIYSHDRFHELCDEAGIMVWQDFMTACAQYPDDQDWFLQNVMDEAIEQVKRLRRYPSVVVWCGGNESSSAHRYQPTQPGTRLAHYYFRGVVDDLTCDTPYVYSSPHSKSDFGQIQTSGESHWSTWPRTKDVQWGTFRERLKDIRTVFNGEVSMQGPSPLESELRFATKEDLWPPNDVVDYHAMCHPACPDVHPRFVISQLKMAEQLIGPCTSAESFINNAMMAHAEVAREELEFYRSRKFDNSGAMLWMYNECWPCANWAMVDYCGYLKPAYYTMKKAFAPVAVCVKRVWDDVTVHLMNDTLEQVSGPLTLTTMDVQGNVFTRVEREVVCPANSAVEALSVAAHEVDPAAQIVRVEWQTGERDLTANYFLPLWKDVDFTAPELTWDLGSRNEPCCGGYRTVVSISSNNYARFVFVEVPGVDPHDVTFSDQYFDLIPGETVTVELVTAAPVDTLTVDSLVRPPA